MLGSPQRSPPPSSARQSLHSHRSQQQLLDLAFQGHDDGAYEPPARLTTGTSTSTLLQDESALMEAADPALFHAGVEEHARRLGMDPVYERDFLWLARESLVAPLPVDWFHATASESGAPYYYNDRTGESRWDHPCDDQFRQIYRELKLQQQLQLSRRYDRYDSPTSLGSDGPEDASSSYYATTSSAYQTLAWEDDASSRNTLNGAVDDVDHTGYYDSPDASTYAAYDPQQWGAASPSSAADDDQRQTAESAALYSEYAYDSAQVSVQSITNVQYVHSTVESADKGPRLCLHCSEWRTQRPSTTPRASLLALDSPPPVAGLQTHRKRRTSRRSTTSTSRSRAYRSS